MLKLRIANSGKANKNKIIIITQMSLTSKRRFSSIGLSIALLVLYFLIINHIIPLQFDPLRPVRPVETCNTSACMF